MENGQSKVEIDFKEIAEIISKNCPSKFTRCHEMAYIINDGMRMKGNETLEKHGYYFDSFPALSLFWKGYMDHSWVKDKLSGLILDAYCNRPCGPGGEEVCNSVQFEIVKNRSDKIRYLPWRINYNLREGTEDIARKLFI